MENSLLKGLKQAATFKHTENGALAKNTTGSACYDLFALGASYRNRSDDDVIQLFKAAYKEDRRKALRILFYIRDIRSDTYTNDDGQQVRVGGQGERRFFRLCYKWLCDNDPDTAMLNLHLIAHFGRVDDLFYCVEGTKIEKKALQRIAIYYQQFLDEWELEKLMAYQAKLQEET